MQNGVSHYALTRNLSSSAPCGLDSLRFHSKPFGDKSHIIYVNGAYKGDLSTPLARLVHDLFCTEPDDMHYKELAERARYFKKDSKGVEAMCEIWEEVRSEGRAEGLTEAINSLMQTTGWTVEKVMEALKIPKVEWEKYKAAVQE